MVLFDEGEDEVLTKIVARPRSPPPAVVTKSGSFSSSSSGRALPGARSSGLQKTFSEPTLRRRDQPTGAEPSKLNLGRFRSGLEQDLRDLDAAAAIRRRNQREFEYAARAEVAMRRQYQRSIDASRAPEKPAWSPTEPQMYFSVPVAENDSRIEVTPVRKALQKEVSNKVDWVAADNTLRDFGTKPAELMGRGERKFHKRLNDRLATIQAEAKAEHDRLSDGKYLRQVAKNAGGDFSALNREKEPWATQLTSKPYFSSFDAVPGADDCDPALKAYIEQPERATSSAPDIVIGDSQKTSHWKPRGGPAGTSTRQAKAQELLRPPCQRDKAARKETF